MKDLTPRSEHGTVVCEIAAGSGAHLVVADVFGVDTNARLLAAADAIASALELAGLEVDARDQHQCCRPYNPILEHIIARTLASSALIVAAADNKGRAAAPVILRHTRASLRSLQWMSAAGSIAAPTGATM